MKSKILWSLPSVVLAFAILFFSVLQASAIEYQFTSSGQSISDQNIELQTPYPLNEGKIGPTNVLWPLKVMTERISLSFKTTSLGEAELLLSYADERLMFAKDLFENGNAAKGAEVLVKSQMYLAESFKSEREAHKEGKDTTEFLKKLSGASITHKQIIDQISAIAPEDARSMVVKTSDYSVRLYGETKTELYANGVLD